MSSWQVVPEAEMPKVLDAVKDGRCVACYQDIDQSCPAGHGFYCCGCDDVECTPKDRRGLMPFEPDDEDLDLGTPVVVAPDGTTQSLADWVRGTDSESETQDVRLRRRDPVEKAAYMLTQLVKGGPPAAGTEFDLALGILTVEAIIEAVAARTVETTRTDPPEPLRSRLYTDWHINVRKDDYEAIRYQNGDVTRIGVYPTRNEAWAAMQRDRAEELADPLVFETRSPRIEFR